MLAQHVYWSVGRGLADARAQGKTLLRLKVVLDEGGWALAPGVSAGSVPLPTADRLETMVTLASECGLLLAAAGQSFDEGLLDVVLQCYSEGSGQNSHN